MANNKQTLHYYAIHLGCPKLDVDQAYLEGGLDSRGIQNVESAAEADLVIVSTCAFIGDARAEAIDTILEAVTWKEQQEGRKLFVTGCMPVIYRNELETEIPEVDGWYTPSEFPEAIADLAKDFSSRKADRTRFQGADDSLIVHPGQLPAGFVSSYNEKRKRSKTAFEYIKIAEGCNRHCAYCAIPQIRGPYRSRPEQEILVEVRDLIERGASEIIVVGEEINSYGRDLKPASRIESLLPSIGEEIARVNPEAWLRILYTHPPAFTESFIQALTETKNLVPYIDFPIEHADDRVLEAMGRRSRWKELRHWIERLRETIPDVVLRSSVIVGHPGEEEKEFDTLLTRLEEVAFERLGVFRYSEEQGTRAFGKEKADAETAFRRQAEVMAIAEEHGHRWAETKIGEVINVIVDGIDEDGYGIGRTCWDAPEVDFVTIFDRQVPPGTIARAKVLNVTAQTLAVELLS